MNTVSIFEAREAYTNEKMAHFRRELATRLEHTAEREASVSTCIYATGSAGRGELGEHSDLDTFLLRLGSEAPQLDQILLQSAVIRALRACNFPLPSNDGQFLKLHTLEGLTDQMGATHDDWSNTFTARMLLLLESVPITGKEAYDVAVNNILQQAYWKNSELHSEDYLPIILVNDIIRYWRIVLLNYESKNLQNKDKPTAERWLRSYKLTFSRCTICYSSLAYLLDLSQGERPNVPLDAVKDMVYLTPRQRLLAVSARGTGAVRDCVDRLLTLYASFLEVTNIEKMRLVEQFQDRGFNRERAREKKSFGEAMFKLIESLGAKSPLYRYLVV